MKVMQNMVHYCSIRRMVFCWVILSVLSVISVHVHGQTDPLGFISIDCGLTPGTSYVDSLTKLTYVSDDPFIDTGVNYPISSTYASGAPYPQYLNVRSFPNGTRNCYTFNSSGAGSKYLVRAKFMYGNYDNLNKLPTFDMHFGVNFWETVSFTGSDDAFLIETIATAPSDYIQICLVNKGLGTPFISQLDLRPLKSTIYPHANASQSFRLVLRVNVGASQTPYLRYPDDPYDRIWQNYSRSTWTEISTTSKITTDQTFAVPSAVLQTAAIGSTASPSLNFSWTPDNSSAKYFTILHMTEIQNLPSTSLREFDILLNGDNLLPKHFVPFKFESDWMYLPGQDIPKYEWYLRRTLNSTLPPILNAIEIFMVMPVILVPSHSGDVNAINTIKSNYKINKGWNGDPCAPTTLIWSGVTCTSNSSGASRITGLSVSSSGLSGAMISAFGDLTALKKLDLSWNKLSGPMPGSLDQLTALTVLDISGNSLTLSPGLQKKQESGALTVINSNSPPPCTSNCNKKKSWVIIVIVVVVLFVLIAGIVTTILLCLRKRRTYTNTNGQTHQNYGGTPLNNAENYVPSRNAPFQFQNSSGGMNANIHEGGQISENQQFNYMELQMITNNFQTNIGTGGFGSVYVGRLENGTQVAVKKRSQSSSQGIKEFLAEAKNLTRVHHKNLVSLIGYCMDPDCMALVYEYMKEGTLQDKLIDNAQPLPWKERLRIAYESAQGLDYLHKSCNPPLIHRDVKSNNILLNANLEAKIADFGLSRAFDNKVSTHVSTVVVGTPGYLDPEYYNSYQLSEKSDVYSFGVVLLEIVTGQPPIIGGPEGGHLSKYVKERLSKGDIESIVDQRMRGQYDINSIWKVTTLAEKCTDRSTSRRPTMNMVVDELRESLQLEISTEATRTTSTTYTNQYTNQYNYSRKDNLASDISQNSGLEMAYMHGERTAGPGPSAR